VRPVRQRLVIAFRAIDGDQAIFDEALQDVRKLGLVVAGRPQGLDRLLPAVSARPRRS